MDEKSRLIIESMLAEEAFYSGRSSIQPAMQRVASSPPRSSKTAQFGAQGRTMPSLTLAARTGAYVGKATSDGKDSKKRKNSNERAGRPKRTASEGRYIFLYCSCIAMYQSASGSYQSSCFFRFIDSRLNAKLSSADLPSHNTRWTTEEDARLRQGIVSS